MAARDCPAQATLAGSLGMQLVRLTVPWQPGQTVPDPATVSSLESAPSSTGLVLELNAAQMPDDEEGRAALEQAAMLRPNQPAYFLALGNAWLRKPDLFEAEQAFRRALALHPHLERIPDLVKRLTETVEGRSL